MFHPTESNSYKSTYTGPITKDGRFIKFEQKIEDVHMKIGYWTFNSAHEGQAYQYEMHAPELFLLAQLSEGDSPDDIEITWNPGSRDKFCRPRRGTAKQHIAAILEERSLLGLDGLPQSTVPVYPYDPNNQLLKSRQQKNYALSVAARPCSHCRDKRRGCSKEIPACKLCLSHGKECVYPPDSRSSTPTTFDQGHDRSTDRSTDSRKKSSTSSESAQESSSQAKSRSRNSRGTDASVRSSKQAPGLRADTEKSKMTTFQGRQDPNCDAQTTSRLLPTLAPKPPEMNSYPTSVLSFPQYVPNETYRASGIIEAFKRNRVHGLPDEQIRSHGTSASDASFPLQSAFRSSLVIPHPPNLLDPALSPLLERRSLPSHNLQVPTSVHPVQPRKLSLDDIQPQSSAPALRGGGTMQGTGQITLDQASPFADGEEDTTMQDDGNILMQEDHPIVHEEAGRGDDCNMQNDGETLIQQESSVAKGSAQAREKVFAIEADGEIERLQQSAVGNAGETEHSEDTSSQELAIGDFTEPSSHEVKEVTALSLHIFSAPLPCIECGVEDGHDYSCGIGAMTRALLTKYNHPPAQEIRHLADAVERLMPEQWHSSERPQIEDPERKVKEMANFIPVDERCVVGSLRQLADDCALLRSFFGNEWLDGEFRGIVDSESAHSEDDVSDNASDMQARPTRIDEQVLLSGGYIIRSKGLNDA